MKTRIAALCILLVVVVILLYSDIDFVSFGEKSEEGVRDCKGDVHLLYGFWVCQNE